MFNLQKKPSDFEALSKVAQILLEKPDSPRLVHEIVDSALFQLSHLGARFHLAVLCLVDKKNNQLKRVAFSHTETGGVLVKKLFESANANFNDLKIDMNENENYSVKAILEKKIFYVHSYYDILRPFLNHEQSDLLQKAAGIRTSVVCPIIVNGQAIGSIIFSTKKFLHHPKGRDLVLIKSLANIIGIAVENSNLFKQIERDKRILGRMNEKLKITDELKDEFVSVASHELRTPMTAIKNYLWLVLNHFDAENLEKNREFIKIAYRSTERLIVMVNDMLTISRIEGNRYTLNRQRTDMREIVSACHQDLLPIAASKNLFFTINLPDHPLEVNVDSARINEVLLNLTGNALKFTTEGGVTLHLRKNCNQICLDIIDTGVGLEKKDFGKLFKKFCRLEHSYAKIKETGTGLGLYISKEILRLHSGRIEVKSEVGKGSTFTIILPALKYKNKL